jgi:hypothetical protein
MQPGNGALYHPAGLAQTAAMGRMAARDPHGEALLFELGTQASGIVAPVGVKQTGFTVGRAVLAADGRYSLEQRLHLRHIMGGLGQNDDERDASHFG